MLCCQLPVSVFSTRWRPCSIKCNFSSPLSKNFSSLFLQKKRKHKVLKCTQFRIFLNEHSGSVISSSFSHKIADTIPSIPVYMLEVSLGEALNPSVFLTYKSLWLRVSARWLSCKHGMKVGSLLFFKQILRKVKAFWQSFSIWMKIEKYLVCSDTIHITVTVTNAIFIQLNLIWAQFSILDIPRCFPDTKQVVFNPWT